MALDIKLAGQQRVVQNWLNCENFANGITARPNNPNALYNEFDKKYRPGDGREGFLLQKFYMPKKDCMFYKTKEANKELVQRYAKKTHIVFPVHPSTLKNTDVFKINMFSRKLFSISTVIPTASTRTVFVDESEQLHCVKLHSNNVITRWMRSLDAPTVRHSIAVTRIFEKSKIFKENKNIGYFPESVGACLGSQKKDWGFLVRDMQPTPIREDLEKAELVPLNSLYKPDKRFPKSVPKLVKWIKKSKEDPKAFVIDRVIKPLLVNWAKIYLETGVLLEPHGQNVCVQVQNSLPRRFVFRDFDTAVNGDLLKKAKIKVRGLDKDGVIDNERSTKAVSLIFDRSVKTMLDDIADLMQKHFQIKKEDLHKKVRKFLKKEVPDFFEHLPEDGKARSYKRIKGVEKKVWIDLLNPWRSRPKKLKTVCDV